MSYKKNSSSNRDALFGGISGNGAPSAKSKTSRPSSAGVPAKTTMTAPAAPLSTTTTRTIPAKKVVPTVPSLSAEAKAQRLQQAEEYRDKANKAMQKSFFSKPDPVAASTFYKRAAECYQALGDLRLERMYRLESAECNRMIAAWPSAAADYTRAAELYLVAPDMPLEQGRKQACLAHKKAAACWTEKDEKAKAAASQMAAAICLFDSDNAVVVIEKDTLTAIEEAVEAHVPDVLNPFARYRQTGCSAFIDPNSEEETVENPSAGALELANTAIVTRAYAHEPLQKVLPLLIQAREYASALYAAGAATVILERDGISTLSLSRAYVVETILLLALGDAVAANQQFMNRHVQSTAYLTSRECKLAEELIRAIQNRDEDALEEAIQSNRSALANLDPTTRDLVGCLRVSGVARPRGQYGERRERKPSKNAPGSIEPVAVAPPEPSLQEILKKKTGYEEEVAAGAELDTDELQAELDDLDFGSDADDVGVDQDLDELEDDDIDLR